MNDITAGQGHNRGPSLEDTMRERAREDHPNLFKRHDELLASAERMPKTLDATSEPKAITFIQQLRAHGNKLEATRTDMKEPYLKGGQAVDSTFKELKAEISGVQSSTNDALTDFQNEERKKREAEAAAERKRLAEEARKQAEAERKAREEEARKERETAERITRELRDEKDLEEAIRAEERAMEAERKAAEVAAAPPEPAPPVVAPAPVQTHTEFGGKATLKMVLRCTSFDPQTIDLNAIRPYLKPDAIQKALNLAVRQGIREVEGAVIEEVPESRVR